MFLWIFVTKCIDKSCSDDLIKSCAFFIGKSMLSHIFFWPRKIYFFMRNIEVPTKNNRFLFFQFFYMHQKCRIPLFFTK